VPWHLTTVEFVSRQVADSLDDGGVYAVNMIDYPPLGSPCPCRDARAVFAHTSRCSRRPSGSPAGRRQLRAGRPDDDLRLEAGRGRGDGWDVLAADRRSRWIGDAPVLTDDYAPVDQLLTDP
jgi:hypothetical protein